jgi:hypothetical protein
MYCIQYCIQYHLKCAHLLARPPRGLLNIEKEYISTSLPYDWIGRGILAKPDVWAVQFMQSISHNSPGPAQPLNWSLIPRLPSLPALVLQC